MKDLSADQGRILSAMDISCGKPRVEQSREGNDIPAGKQHWGSGADLETFHQSQRRRIHILVEWSKGVIIGQSWEEMDISAG